MKDWLPKNLPDYQYKVLEKLGLGYRSATNILRNEKLCKRILAEEVQDVTKFIETNKIGLHTIKKLSLDGTITAFGNRIWTKGSKTFIFTKELEEYLNFPFYINSHNAGVRKMVEIYISITPGITEPERELLDALLHPYKLKEISKRLKRGVPAILFRQDRALKKLLNAKFRVPEVQELRDEKMNLLIDIKNLKEYRDNLRRTMSRTAQYLASSISTLNTPITEVNFSVRAFNVLNRVDCKTLSDVVKLSEFQLSKYRDCGAKTIQEIKDTLELYKLWLGYYEHDNPSKTKNS